MRKIVARIDIGIEKNKLLALIALVLSLSGFYALGQESESPDDNLLLNTSEGVSEGER